ncbi:TonB-dependent receptor [Parabacteroides sp.]|uniref:SusC/RagA family TonB-linked outer membrane protein n=1 Tax=Parabacteroides sp. TaxID=1869337 RepID=UPI00257D3C45|nr:TonB-dependent receptor [Parabacteroides sp.]
MLKIVRPVSFVLLSAAFCFGGVVHASDRAAITPRVGISQQEGSLKGTVSDSFGPVAGASIVVKGTTNGTVTDMNGNFVLDVKKGDVIQVSFIGYLTQEFKYNGEPSINVSLQEDTQKLDEVIVVGYGTQQKANLSGAVAQLDSKELTSRPISNVSSGLQGMMPGVTVTSGQGRPGQDGSTIRIRGVGTLNSASPYILIDGIESGSMNDIDPNDIESISVLKDASSAAIYGSKASNGVILITTKRGKTGAPRISYNGYVGASKATSMIDRVSSADYARLWNRFEPGRYSDEDIRMFEDGSDPYGHPNTDWNDEAYRTGLLHKHNVSITGGAENVKYMASAGYLGQTGILPNSDRKQFNGRTNLDMQLTKKLAVRMNMSFIKNDFSDPNASYYGGSSDQIIRQLNIISPMIPVKDKDGKYGQTNDGNPIAWLDSGQTVDNCNQNFTGALSVDYDIIDGLKATVTGAYVNEDQRHTERVLSIPDDPASASRTTSLVERFVNWKRYNFDALLNYSKNFGQHGLKVMVGYHAEKYEVSKNQMQRNNFPSNSLNDMDAGGASTQTNDGLSRELAMLSYFGRINYDFAGKYLLEANFRADASSRFAPGHRWGYFPSFSGAWRISEEAFMEGSRDWLNSLKIRASWGMLGNQDALNKSNPWENQYYPWMQTYNLDGNYPMGGNLTTGYYQKAYRIEDLSWEKSTTWGIGLDAVINHVTFTFDYYDRKTTDIIMEVPVPTEFGLDPYFDNVGSMRNRGVEVQLGYNNKWNDWSLNVMGNMAYNKNKIEDLGGVDRMTNPDDGDLWRFVGKPIDSYYVYKADGFFQSDAEAQQWMDTYKGKDGYPFGQDFQAGDLRYVDTNGDGKLDADDRVLSKTINPVVTFGLNLNVGYKAFDLTLNFTGAANVGRAFTKEAFGEFSGSAGHPSTAWLDSWTPENTNASMPRVAESRKSPSEASNVMSDFWVINTSYLRLKTLQLGYTLPKSVLSAIGLSNVRVYYSAENLFTIDSMPLNVDPETVSSRLSSYPLVMTNSFGVNVTF